MDVKALFDLGGRTALVTGGAQGLGRMIAEGLIGAGAKVYVTSRDPAVCEQAAAEMGALPLPADLSTPEAAVDLARRLGERESALNILVNNAGKTWGAPVDSFPDKAWPGVLSVNIQAPFTLIRELLPMLEKAGRPCDPARVLNIGSVGGTVTEQLSAYSYSASKAAIHHLSRVLARDLAGRNIAVNALAPGFFPTKMTAHYRKEEEVLAELTGRIPLGRIGTPEDIAGLTVFLASRAGAYVTGAVIPLDGGLSGCA